MPMIRCICFASRVWRSFYFICCCRCLPLLLLWFLAAIRSSAIINISFQLCGRDSALFLLFIYVILFISVPFNVNDWTKKKFKLFNQSITCVCARAWVPLSWRNSTERKKTPLNLKIGACVRVCFCGCCRRRRRSCHHQHRCYCCCCCRFVSCWCMAMAWTGIISCRSWFQLDELYFTIESSAFVLYFVMLNGITKSEETERHRESGKKFKCKRNKLVLQARLEP